ncbi:MULTISPECIES: flagellar hook-length control protein FliK [unclassified Nocardioides]|uniref:flagellar hook-length control protein FliK n=1 Tax=unclassified Nocardioides TaxID=2615069 RepID=UPI0030142069
MSTMTTTPAGAARTAGASSGPTAGGATAGDATGFGDLLAALVPGSPAGLALASSTPAGVCGAGPEVIVSQEDVVVGATDSAQVVVGAAGDDTAGSRTGDPGAVVPADEAEPATDPGAVVDAALLAQAQLAALPLLAPATAAPVPVVAGATADVPVEGVEGATPAGDVALPGEAVVEPGPSTSADAGSSDPGSDPDRSAPQPAAPAAATTGTAPSPTPTPSAPAVDATAAVALAPTVGTTAPAPTLTRGEARPADAVPGQVFPEVVRLSQSGPGTHRVTLRLDPGTLGEVRVTLTVRDGEVQVRLAAQHDAREVLAQAAPDLRRLLEQSGSVDARVAVADLTTGTTTDTSGDRPYGGDRGAGTDADGERPASYDGRERESSRARVDAERLAASERIREARPRSGLDLAL